MRLYQYYARVVVVSTDALSVLSTMQITRVRARPPIMYKYLSAMTTVRVSPCHRMVFFSQKKKNVLVKIVLYPPVLRRDHVIREGLRRRINVYIIPTGILFFEQNSIETIKRHVLRF